MLRGEIGYLEKKPTTEVATLYYIQACPCDAITLHEKGGKNQKCNLCYNMVINGLYPASVDNICLVHCLYFGDPAEIEERFCRRER